MGWAGIVDSDGAAALVLVSGEKALKLGLQVVAKITGYADAAQVVEIIMLAFVLVLVGKSLALKQYFLVGT